MKRFLKRFFAVVVGLIMSAFIYGCSTTAIIPTLTNDLLEQVAGVKAPYIKVFGFKVTFQGCNDYIESVADFEHEYTYPAAKEWESMGRARSVKVGLAVLGLISMTGLGGASLLPLALKALPKGAVSEADHAARVKAAGRMSPDEFEAQG